jgi:hypothetical protein
MYKFPKRLKKLDDSYLQVWKSVILMPSTSAKQRKFMWLVHGIQKGKISSSHAGEKASKAAHSMDPTDVKDFLMQEMGLKELNIGTRQRLLNHLKGLYNSTAKEVVEPMMLEDDEDQKIPNVVASTKAYHGDFDSTLKMYRGFELTPKENQAIQGFDETEPTAHDKFKVQFSKSDEFGNTSTIVVKKLREPSGKFCFVALTKVRSGEEEEPTTPETPTPPAEQGKKPAPPAGKPPQGGQPPLTEGDDPSAEEIKITKSVPFPDSDGSQILTNFIQSVYHELA